MSAHSSDAVRGLLALAVGVVSLGFLAAACSGQEVAKPSARPAESSLRLSARPRPGAPSCRAGEYELPMGSSRRALMLVTPSAGSKRRALLLALHGAGSGGAPGGLWAFRGAWDLPGLVIVAPSAAGSGWSTGSIDVRFVDRALRSAFARCAVDRRRISIGGFSSGAGMTLWLGLVNGDLFRSLVVLSGGGSLPDERVGKPVVFVAHGTSDGVIPISLGGDRTVRDLRADGYRVVYRRFQGGHRVDRSIARSAVARYVLGLGR